LAKYSLTFFRTLLYFYLQANNSKDPDLLLCKGSDYNTQKRFCVSELVTTIQKMILTYVLIS